MDCLFSKSVEKFGEPEYHCFGDLSKKLNPAKVKKATESLKEKQFLSFEV
jgi:hypothetical protein